MIIWTLDDLNEANFILAVLGKVPLPYEQMHPLITKLRTQTEEQLNPAPPPERKRIKPG